MGANRWLTTRSKNRRSASDGLARAVERDTLYVMTATVNPLEAVWTQREEVIYPSLFGAKSRGIFVLDREVFSTVFGHNPYAAARTVQGIYERAQVSRSADADVKPIRWRHIHATQEG